MQEREVQKDEKKTFKLDVVEKSGITMIALVITIIVLLILATISVATLTGENGILTKAQEAKIATEKAAIEEQLRLAQLSAKAQAMGGPIDIQDILDELDKAGVDYEVIEGEGGGTTIIIDGEYIYDIIDKEGDIEFETQGTVDKPMPRILTLEANYEENTIKVKVTTKENEEGTLEFYIKEENDTDYTKKETVEQAPAEYEYLFEEIDVTKVYQIKVVAIAKNGERKEKEITVVGIPTLNSSNTIFSYTPTSYIKENVTVTITTKNINMAGYTLQYAIDNPEVESNWKNYTTSILMQQNGDVYVRLRDNNKKQVGKHTKIGSITNIDRDGPVFKGEPKVTTTSHSATIELEEDAEDKGSGFGYYQYSRDDGKTWEPDGTMSRSYTFDNLPQRYGVHLKIKAVDRLGNEATTETIHTATGTVTQLTQANTQFKYEPEGYTNDDKVKVTITLAEDIQSEDMILEYKTELTGENDEVEVWTPYPSKGVSLTRNQEIYARVVDITGQSAGEKLYATGNVEKIDRQPPDKFDITQELSNDIDATLTGEQAGINSVLIPSDCYSGMVIHVSSDGYYERDNRGMITKVPFSAGYYRCYRVFTDEEFNSELSSFYQKFGVYCSESFEYLGKSYAELSVTITGMTTDTETEEYPASGIAYYEFAISEDNGATWKAWEGKQKPAGGQKASRTFEKLQEGKKYKFKMRATDNADNETIMEKALVHLHL